MPGNINKTLSPERERIAKSSACRAQMQPSSTETKPLRKQINKQIEIELTAISP